MGSQPRPQTRPSRNEGMRGGGVDMRKQIAMVALLVISFASLGGYWDRDLMLPRGAVALRRSALPLELDQTKIAEDIGGAARDIQCSLSKPSKHEGGAPAEEAALPLSDAE